MALAMSFGMLSSSLAPAIYADSPYTINYTAKAPLQLDGAEYQILKVGSVGANGNLTPVDPAQKVGSALTVASGKFTTTVTDKGRYEIKNIKRAPGYLLNETSGFVQFPKMKNGAIDPDQTYNITGKGTEVNIDFEFKKVDAETKPLPGATFSLRRTHAPQTIGDDNTVTAWKEVKEDPVVRQSEETTGKVVFQNLKEGKYELIETAQPEGYASNNSKYTFTVTVKKNKPVIKDRRVFSTIANYLKPTAEKKLVDLSTQKEVDDLNINVATPYEYKLKVKVPANIGSYSKFVIEDIADGSLKFGSIKSIMYNNTPLDVSLGQITPEKLTLDVLDKLKEITNNRKYFHDGELVVTISSEIKGSVTEVKKIPNNFTLDYDNNHGCKEKITSNVVNVTPTFGSVDFKKVNSDGQALTGVEFELYEETKSDKDKVFEEGGVKYKKAIDRTTGKPYEVFKTQAEGKLVVSNLPHGKYAFKEVKTLDVYQLKEDPIPFEITAAKAKLVLDDVVNYKRGEIVIDTGTIGSLGAIGVATALGIVGYVKRRKENQAE